MKRSIEILNRKQKEIYNAKMAINKNTVWDDTEKYQLNMEMLTWIVNTDSLFRKLSNRYRKEKFSFEKTEDKTRGNSFHGVLLGLYYAFNCFKHNMNLLSVEEINYIDFINTEDANYKIANNVWIESKYLLDEGKYRFYVSYVEGTNVYESFTRTVSFLNQQYNMIQQEIN